MLFYLRGNMTNNFKTIIIEGCIGVGKSHFATELTEYLGINTLYFDEPTNENNANPYLDLYYKDPSRWAYVMQTHLLQKRFRAHLEAQWHVLNNKGHAVMDRSYFGDVCFAYLQRDSEYMTADEFATYLEIYECMTANVLYPNVCIVLDIHAEAAWKRINKRHRECELQTDSPLTIDYLRSIIKNIHKMSKELSKKGTQIIELDWSFDRPSKESRAQLIKQVGNIITNQKKEKEFTSRIS